MYFSTKTKNYKYLKPVELILKNHNLREYDHVEEGISRYAIDENY